MAQPTTLKDVARLAGVSTATVARVLHNNGYVARETRRVVEAAIGETGYQLNAVAQGLRKRRTLTLGHLLLSISANPFFAGVALGVEQEAAANGCGVLTVNTQGDPGRERFGVETLIRRRVDAMLFTTYSDEASIRLALNAGIPVVQVERAAPIATQAVTVDNYRGSFAATEHFVTLGHRRIAYIGESPDAHAAGVVRGPSRVVERERLAGYLDALQAHGVHCDPALLDLDGTYYDVPRARAATRRFLSLPGDRRPTAIFATCDLLAAAVLQEAYDAGLKIPDDLSVIGFDDTHAPYLTPPLTTVAQPKIEIGRTAVQLAIGRLSGDVGSNDRNGRDDEQSVRLTTVLIVRASTGPPAP
jgi:DNA-binding LacI/PurR family transcriptional regulator